MRQFSPCGHADDLRSPCERTRNKEGKYVRGERRGRERSKKGERGRETNRQSERKLAADAVFRSQRVASKRGWESLRPCLPRWTNNQRVRFYFCSVRTHIMCRGIAFPPSLFFVFLYACICLLCSCFFFFVSELRLTEHQEMADVQTSLEKGKFEVAFPL